MMKTIFVILLTVSVLINVSCSKEIQEAFAEMFQLSAKLSEKYGEGAPNVSIGGNGIAVTFVNASFNDLPPDEKKIKAREVAIFVKENYPKIEKIQEIVIVFGVYKDYYGFQYKNTLDSYPFKVSELNMIKKTSVQLNF